MKILNIVSKGYAHGGAETIIIQTNAHLSNEGYDVKTLASDLGADKKHFNEYTFRGIHSFPFTGGTSVSPFPRPFQYIEYPFKLLFFLFNPFSFFP